MGAAKPSDADLIHLARRRAAQYFNDGGLLCGTTILLFKVLLAEQVCFYSFGDNRKGDQVNQNNTFGAGSQSVRCTVYQKINIYK